MFVALAQHLGEQTLAGKRVCWFVIFGGLGDLSPSYLLPSSAIFAYFEKFEIQKVSALLRDSSAPLWDSLALWGFTFLVCYFLGGVVSFLVCCPAFLCGGCTFGVL